MRESRCTNIIASRGCGTAAVLILTNPRSVSACRARWADVTGKSRSRLLLRRSSLPCLDDQFDLERAVLQNSSRCFAFSW